MTLLCLLGLHRWRDRCVCAACTRTRDHGHEWETVVEYATNHSADAEWTLYTCTHCGANRYVESTRCYSCSGDGTWEDEYADMCDVNGVTLTGVSTTRYCSCTGGWINSDIDAASWKRGSAEIAAE